MREVKKFGVRKRALDNNEVIKKYFLLFEGDKTEKIYFEGLDKFKSSIKIKDSIEL